MFTTGILKSSKKRVICFPPGGQKVFPVTAVNQLSQTARILSGSDGSLVELVPELACFRDIIFYFKHSVSGTSPTTIESKSSGSNFSENYLPAHATLHWGTSVSNQSESTSKSSTPGKSDVTNLPIYAASAFGGTNQTFVKIIDESGNTLQNAFKNFVSLFTKNSVERSKLSSADPTNVVASCR